MRDDADFIGELREEIAASQQRRHDFVAAKLMFLIGLLGLGSISIGELQTRELLFLVPVIAFIYDLYILGEDYGIRRAGVFIRLSSAAPAEEVLWERTVQEYKDPFSLAAGPLSSALAVVIAALGLVANVAPAIYRSWLFFSVLLFGCIWIYQRRLVRRLQRWKEELKEKRAEDATSAPLSSPTVVQ